MAKARKRVSKRGKPSAEPIRKKKTAKRATPTKAKSKVRRAVTSAPKLAAKKKRPPKTAAKKVPRQMAELPTETTIIDIIEEPVPGVFVVTEYESVRTTAPISPGGKSARGEGIGPKSEE